MGCLRRETLKVVAEILIFLRVFFGLKYLKVIEIKYGCLLILKHCVKYLPARE